jgi:NADPH2:quinone reductase
MKTIEMREPGDPDVLYVGERERPVPVPGEVLIEVAAAGVNGPDRLQRRGLYPPPKGASDLMGLEVSGHIAALGDGVDGWSEGNACCALVNGGGYAGFVAVPAGQVLPVPEGVDLIDAAGLCETYFTVWNNFFLDLTHKKGDLFLVHGGSGGIGSTAIQLGRAHGMRVFATAGSAESCAWCEKLGAERAIRYDTEDFVTVVKEAGGADLVLDMRGGDYIARNMAASNAEARIVQLAFNAGSKVDVDLMPIMLRRLTLTGSTLRPRDAAFKSRIAADLKEKAWPLFADGTLRATTFKRVPFEDAAKAHRLMEEGGLRGKLILTL